MRRVAIMAAVIVAIAAAVIAVMSIDGVGAAIERAARRAAEAGAVGVVVFAAVFVIATVGFVPQSALLVPAGFSYGLREGFAIGLCASYAAAAISVWLGRSALREQVARRYRRDRRLAKLEKNVRAHGLAYVVVMRLSPVFPFAAVNYLFAASAVRPWQYAVGTALGLVPLTLAYVYFGSIAPVLHG